MFERRSVEHNCGVFLHFFFSSRRRHTRFDCDWSSDVCSSDLRQTIAAHATIGSHPPAASSLPRKKRIGGASPRLLPKFSDSLEREVYRVFHCASDRKSVV